MLFLILVSNITSTLLEVHGRRFWVLLMISFGVGFLGCYLFCLVDVGIVD